MSFTYKGIVGAPFSDQVIRQLDARSNYILDNPKGYSTFSRNAWVRLASGVEKTEQTPESLKSIPSWDKYVLSGEAITDPDNLRYGLGKESPYPLYVHNAQEGFKPTPGILSVEVTSAGTLQSLRIATVRFKVWSVEEFDKVDFLFLRLGYTCILEWGHTRFINSKTGNIQDTPPPLIDKLVKDKKQYTIQEITQQLHKNRITSEGNQDGMIGLVTNFKWSKGTDGAYDCTLTLTSLGTLQYAININTQDGDKLVAEEGPEEEEVTVQQSLSVFSQNKPDYRPCANNILNIGTLESPITIPQNSKVRVDLSQLRNITKNATLVFFPTNRKSTRVLLNFQPGWAGSGKLVITGTSILSQVYHLYDSIARYHVTSEVGTYRGFNTLKNYSGAIDNPVFVALQMLYNLGYNLDSILANVPRKIIYKDSKILSVVETEQNFKEGARVTEEVSLYVGLNAKLYENTTLADFFNSEVSLVTESTEVKKLVSIALDIALVAQDSKEKDNSSPQNVFNNILKSKNTYGLEYLEAFLSILTQKVIIGGELQMSLFSEYWETQVTTLAGIPSDKSKFIVQRNWDNQGINTCTQEGVKDPIFNLNGNSTVRLIGRPGYERNTKLYVTEVDFKYGSQYTTGEYITAGINVSLIPQNPDTPIYALWNSELGIYMLDTNGVPLVTTAVDPNKQRPVNYTLSQFTDGKTLTSLDDNLLKCITPSLYQYPEVFFDIQNTSDISVAISINETRTSNSALAQQALSLINDNVNIVNNSNTEQNTKDGKVVNEYLKVIINGFSGQSQTVRLSLQKIPAASTPPPAQSTLIDTEQSQVNVPISFLQTFFTLLKEIRLNRDFNAEALINQIYKNVFSPPGSVSFLPNTYLSTRDSKYLDADVKKGFNSDYMRDPAIGTNIPDCEISKLLDTFNILKLQTAQNTGADQEIVYIPLGLVLMVINSISLLYTSNRGISRNNQIFSIDFNTQTNFYLTTPYHYSVDPSVCILPNEFSKENLKKIKFNQLISLPPDIGGDRKLSLQQAIDKISDQVLDVGNDFRLNASINNRAEIVRGDSSTAYRGCTMFIMLNIDLVVATLNSLEQAAIKNKSNGVVLDDFLNNILRQIEAATGNVNSFNVKYFDDSNTIKIVDEQQIPGYEKNFTYKFPVYSKKSIVKNINLNTIISPKVHSALAISAQSGDYGQGGVNSSGFNIGQSNVYSVDRYKPKISTGNQNTTLLENQLYDNLVSLYTYLSGIYLSDGINPAQIKGTPPSTFFSYLLGNSKGNEKVLEKRDIIPIALSILTDGISGIDPYQKFSVGSATRIFPSRYYKDGNTGQDLVLDWVVNKVNHKIENQLWETTVEGLMAPKPEEISATNERPIISTGKDNIPATVPSSIEIEGEDPATLWNPERIGINTYDQSALAKDVVTKGWTNGQIDIKLLTPLRGLSGKVLHPDAARQFNLWNSYLQVNLGIRLYVVSPSSAYRTYDQQVSIAQNRERVSATPGNSPHGYGGAVDIVAFTTVGSAGYTVAMSTNTTGAPSLALRERRSLNAQNKVIANLCASKGFTINEKPIRNFYELIVASGREHGWYNPARLSGKNVPAENWHFEYWGPVSTGIKSATKTPSPNYSKDV